MVKFCVDDTTDKIIVTFTGENFQDLVMLFRSKRISFNAEKKGYVINISQFKDILEDVSGMKEDVDIDMYSEKYIREYLSKSELEHSKTRLLFNQDLLKFPPLVGIPPNENFQRDDIKRGLVQNRFLYHLDMGLGKSYILTALIENLRYYKQFGKCLVFSTKIGVENLASEILYFSKSIKEDDIISFSGMADIKFDNRDLFNTEKYPQSIIIMSYDTLKSVSNYYYDIEKGTSKVPHPSSKTDYRKSFMPIEKWIGDTPAGLFLDECHSLSSPKSRRTQIMNMIVPYFKYRYLFTGTLADKYEKLYEPCYILDKKLVEYKNYDNWIDSYNDRGTKFSDYAINPNGWHIDKLEKLNAELLKNYSTKRKLQECLDIPTMIDMPVLQVSMGKLQRKIYEMFSTYTINDLFNKSKEDGKFSQRMLNMFPYLQLAVDNPSCLLNSEKFEEFDIELQKLIQEYDYQKDNTKMDYFDEILREEVDENEHRGVMWFFHPITQISLAERYKKYNPIVIGSEVEEKERFERIKKFKSDKKHKIIIASINILNTSVTLTECQFNIYAEKTYKFENYEQSLHRIWRNGQKEITKTYSVRFRDSIDNLQEINIKTKGAVLNALLNKDYIEKGMWKKIFNMNMQDSII